MIPEWLIEYRIIFISQMFQRLGVYVAKASPVPYMFLESKELTAKLTFGKILSSEGLLKGIINPFVVREVD